MNTYRATLKIGSKTVQATVKAKSQAQAYQKVFDASTEKFAGQSVMVLKVDREQEGEMLDFLKGMFNS